MKSEEAKEIIVNNQMGYRDFASYFNILIDDSLKIFYYLDLRRCSKGQNCLNLDGPVQSRENFCNQKHTRDGSSNQCVYCRKKNIKQHYQNNKEYYKQLSRQHYQDNKEHYKQLSYQYYQNNKDRQKKIRQKYHQNNKEYCNQRNRQYRQNNSEYYNWKTKQNQFHCAKFDTFNDQISYAEKTQQDPNNLELLQVKCTYCNSWFRPTNLQVQHRVSALEGKGSLGTENRFYCSDECKQACPIYLQRKYSRDDPRYYNNLGTSRELQTELRQLVFERDNWTCQKCSTHKDNFAAGISLHCHHLEGIRWEPYESADVDKCITVCNNCHKKIHQIPGCTYQDMQCNDF